MMIRVARIVTVSLCLAVLAIVAVASPSWAAREAYLTVNGQIQGVIQGDSTANELATRHQIHPTLISNCKKALLDGAESLFAEGARSAKAHDQPEAAELFEQIGRLKMELEWLKKKLPER